MVIIDGLEFPNAEITDKGTFEYEGKSYNMKIEKLSKREDFINFYAENKNKKITFFVYPDSTLFKNYPYIMIFRENSSPEIHFLPIVYFRYCLIE